MYSKDSFRYSELQANKSEREGDDQSDIDAPSLSLKKVSQLHHNNEGKLSNQRYGYGAIASQSGQLSSQSFGILQLNSEINHTSAKNDHEIDIAYYKKLSYIVFIVLALTTLGYYVINIGPNPTLQQINTTTTAAGGSPNSIKTSKISKDRDYFQIFNINHDGVIAEGYYYRNYNGNGWNHLHATALVEMPSSFIRNSNDGDRDDEFLFARYFASIEAMGFLEGFVTCHEINNYYINFYSGLFDGSDPAVEIVTFLLDNFDWIRSKAAFEWKESSYWLNVRVVIAQVCDVM